MKHKIIFLIILTVLLLVVSYSNYEDFVLLKCNYFTEKIFYENISKAKDYEISEKPVAAVVPHNEAIMDMTASIIKSISKYEYDTILIIAPNHNAKKGKLLVSGESWTTPIGEMKGDKDLVKDIKKLYIEKIIEESDVVCEDHSCSVIIPYLKQFMPKSKISTILVDKELNMKDIYLLSDIFNEISKKKNILLIGSLDFSHYQSYDETVKRDEQTRNAIENEDLDVLKSFDGKNVDSSETLAMILNFCKLKNKKISIFDERITSNLPLSNDYGSYMSMVCF